MKRYIIIIVSMLICLTITNVNAYAAADTTDGKDEVFYEWVENYVDTPADIYNYDLIVMDRE